MWLTLFVAVLVALLLTIPIVWLLGWRRPGATEQESLLLSVMFLFVLVFLGAWALAGWLTPWGPAFSGVPWLLVLVSAAFVALLVLVATPTPSYAAAGDESARIGEAAEGVGLLFWILAVLLLVAGVIGNTLR